MLARVRCIGRLFEGSARFRSVGGLLYGLEMLGSAQSAQLKLVLLLWIRGAREDGIRGVVGRVHRWQTSTTGSCPGTRERLPLARDGPERQQDGRLSAVGAEESQSTGLSSLPASEQASR